MSALAFVLKYWREIALGLLVALLIGFAVYLRGVFAERDQLKQERAVLATQLQDAQENLRLQNRIAEAISQVQIRSSVNVNRIENEPKPVFAGAGPLPFIPGGVLQAVYTSSTRAAAVAAPAHAPGGPLPPAGSAGGVLPD